MKRESVSLFMYNRPCMTGQYLPRQPMTGKLGMSPLTLKRITENGF